VIVRSAAEPRGEEDRKVPHQASENGGAGSSGSHDAEPGPVPLRVRSRRRAVEDRGLEVRLVRAALLAESVDQAAICISDGIEWVAGADRGLLVLADHSRDGLWIPSAGLSARFTTRYGVFSNVASARRPVLVRRLEDDPGFHLDDLRLAERGDRILLVPIELRERDRTTMLGIGVAVRRGSEPEFESSDGAALEAFLSAARPGVERMVALHETEGELAESEAPHAEDGQRLFRDEALAHDRAGLSGHGAPIQLLPEWLRRAEWTLVALLIALGLFFGLARSDRTARGTAVVHQPRQVLVDSPVSGVAASVHVVPGEEVSSGQRLLELEASRESARLELLLASFEEALVRRLRDPSDRAAADELTRLRRETEGARVELAQRVVDSPVDGVVQHVRVRPGHLVQQGQALVVLTRSGKSDGAVFASLPASLRSHLRPGREVTFVANRSRDERVTLVLHWVADSVVGPAEARRFLGEGVADALAIAGPQVVVEARWPRGADSGGGLEAPLMEAETGVLEVVVDSEPLWLRLLPRGMSP